MLTSAPVDHPLNLTTQSILTFGSWGLTLVFLVVAVQMSRKERTPFYVLLLLAAMVGAFAEPLYDEAMDLYFYSPGLWTHFTAFNIPQPNWTHSGYAVLYGSAALFITRQIAAGRLTRGGLYAWAGVELAMSCTFEMIGINGGAYAYWGPHVLRVLNYPLVIGMLEAAQVITFSVIAAQVRARSNRWPQLLVLFAVFPATFFGANFGAGAPTIVALHLNPFSGSLMYAGTLLSMTAAVLLIRLAAGFIPRAGHHGQ